MKAPFLVCLLAALALNVSAQEYPIPEITLPPDAGKNMVQTMHLLETSGKKSRNKVKIAVYGQSISKQTYWKPIVEELKRRYPYAEIEAKNLSIGGFSTQTLWKTVEMDIVAYYPDLIIFHSYGSHIDYERIMQIFRSRTAAEVLIHTDHYNGPGAWSDTMSYNRLPRYAELYDLELVDVRRPWIDYIEKHNYDPVSLTTDGTHLNDHGLFAMAEILKRYFVYRPEYLQKNAARTTYIPVKKGRPIDVEFEGNRVDLVLNENEDPNTFYPLIDGQKPSQFPTAFVYTRPNNDETKDWPWQTGAAYRIQNNDPVEEDWTLTCTAIDSTYSNEKGLYELSFFEFVVNGSVTGFDGIGRMGEDFVSKSGRVVINANDWWLTEPFARAGVPMCPGYTITWKTVLQGNASDSFSIGADERQKTLIQGLPNGRHRLQMNGSKAIKGLKIYKPHLKEVTMQGESHY